MFYDAMERRLLEFNVRCNAMLVRQTLICYSNITIAID